MLFSSSSVSWCRHGRLNGTASQHSHHNVPQHQDHAAQVEQATCDTDHVERIGCLHAFDEGVNQRTVRVHSTPHQALHHTGNPHCSDVQHDTDGGSPEVQRDGRLSVHLGTTEQTGDQVVQRTDRDHAH